MGATEKPKQSRPTLASLAERLHVLEQRQSDVESLVRAIPAQQRGGTRRPGAPVHTSAAGQGLVTPTCVNFHGRKGVPGCGNKSTGVPLSEAPGWMCESCRGS